MSRPYSKRRELTDENDQDGCLAVRQGNGCLGGQRASPRAQTQQLALYQAWAEGWQELDARG